MSSALLTQGVGVSTPTIVLNGLYANDIAVVTFLRQITLQGDFTVTEGLVGDFTTVESLDGDFTTARTLEGEV